MDADLPRHGGLGEWAHGLGQTAAITELPLIAQATHIVRGKVLDVITKVEKSKIETSPGVHKDTIYIITVEMDVVSKGAVEKKRKDHRPGLAVSRLKGARGHSEER
jgi:hypothetical protein